jgi:hypothetical protein
MKLTETERDIVDVVLAAVVLVIAEIGLLHVLLK